MDVRIPITKLFLALVILAFLAADSEDNHADHSAFFARQKWTVKDAYAAVFCAMGLIFTYSVLLPLWSSAPTSYLEMGSWAVVWWMFAIPTCNELRRHHGVTRLTFGIDKTHFLGSGVLALNIALGYFSLSAAGVRIPPSEILGTGPLFLSSWANAVISGSILLFSFDAAIFGFGLPFFEELLFRGFLYAPVARRAGKWTAIVGLALVECLLYVNLDVAQSAVMFAVFVLLYLIYVRTESLLPPLILHVGINVALLQPLSMALMAHYLELWGHHT